MELIRPLIVVLLFVVTGSQAYGGGRPEFDAVGNDSLNYFNDAVTALVLTANPWNTKSDFTGNPFPGMEYFNPPVQLTGDLCHDGYRSAYTQWRRPARYEWRIVLQMDPQSDLDISIKQCVVKHSSTTVFGKDPWEGGDQTGRYQLTDGTSVFIPGANPSITVEANPGPNAVLGFTSPFILTCRSQGGINDLPLARLPYTGTGIWNRSLVARMPEHQRAAPNQGVEYPLSAGDTIRITIDIPFLNSVDIRYGRDNVTLRYLGVNNTIFTDSD
ncbi:MAG: hypothetical protein GY737_05835 [Desulfobacteraceae bacterium]|nr:hypothetical protein [Desulfobacteraceae bacterium]